MRISKRLSHFSHESEKVLIPFVLFVMGLSHPAVFLVAIVFAAMLLRFDRTLFWALVLFAGLHVMMRVLVSMGPDSTLHEGVITAVDEGEYTVNATVRTRRGLFRVSGFDETPEAGQRIRFEGTFEQADPPLFDGGFDYGNYLRSQNIRGIITLESHAYQPGGRSLIAFRGAARSWFEDRDERTAFLMRTFILADSEGLDETFKDKASALGVSHLFAVSGMHVAFMAGLLYFLMKKIFRLPFADILVGMFLIFYIILTGGPPSVMRSASMAAMLIVVKRTGMPLSAVDIVSLLCIVLLIVRPYSLHDVGFVLSFLVSFTLLMGREALKGMKTVSQAVSVSIMAFLVTVPIVLTLQHQVNLMSVLYNVVLAWVLMVLILPLVYLTACLPVISPVLLKAYGVFEGAIIFLHDHGMVPLRGHVPTGLPWIAYWALFAWMMAAQGNASKQMVRFGLLAGFTGVTLLFGLLNPTTRLTMFPVKGDAFLIQDAFSRCNILIDTGDETTADALVGALSRSHVRRLDYVIITHRHADHFGGYRAVASKFPIDTTITPSNMAPYEGRMTSCGDVRFHIYPFEDHYENENDNSIILWMDTGAAKILFTGDMEHSRENAFLKAHGPLPEVDILKAGHHGSDTSSTDAFLKAVDAKEVLVSAHPNNTFNHPGDEAIGRFKHHGMAIHRTDHSGTVEFIDFLNRRYKKTALRD